MEEKKKTYEDFEIGQSVWCKDIRGIREYEWLLENDHVTIGKEYIIDDLEFRFPKAICIQMNNGSYMFLDIGIFEDNISIIREKNIDKILKEK